MRAWLDHTRGALFGVRVARVAGDPTEASNLAQEHPRDVLLVAQALCHPAALESSLAERRVVKLWNDAQLLHRDPDVVHKNPVFVRHL